MPCEDTQQDLRDCVAGTPLTQRIRNWTRKREISPESAADFGTLDGKHNIPKNPVTTPPHFVRLATGYTEEQNHRNVQSWSKADGPLYEDLAISAEDNDRKSKRLNVAKAERQAAREEHEKCVEARKKHNHVYSIGPLAYFLPLIFLSIPEAVLSFLTLQGISDSTYTLYALAGFMAIVFAFSGHKLGVFARQPLSWRTTAMMLALIVMPMTLVVVAAEIRSKAVLESGLISRFWHGNPPSFGQFMVLFFCINGLIMLIAFALSCCYRRHIPALREADDNLKLADSRLVKTERVYDEIYASLAATRRHYQAIKARREKLAQVWTEKCREQHDWAITIIATYAAANNLTRIDGEEIEFNESMIPVVDLAAYSAEIGRSFEEFPELDEFPDEVDELAA